MIWIIVVIAAVLLLLFILHKKRKPYITKTRISLLDSEVRLVCNFIEKHYADPQLTIHRVCEELHTGESFVESLFEKELGITADTFLEKVRLHHFLSDWGDSLTDDIIDEHARQYGFTDSAAFQECFKRIYPNMPI